MKLVDGEYKNPVKKPIETPYDVLSIFKSLKDEANETLIVAYLYPDLTGHYDVHSTGCPVATMFSITDLFGKAYTLRARYFILIHNHPKGDPSPSPEDLINLDDILAHARPIKNLSMMDFIIVGGDKHWSWFEEQDGGSYTLGALSD